MAKVTEIQTENPPPRVHQERFDYALERLNTSISRLWTGNGAGLVLSITIAGAAAKDGIHLKQNFLICPILFLGGLLCLTIGTLTALGYNMGYLDSADQSKFKQAEPQVMKASEIGLVPWHPETIAAFLACLFFLAGCISALIFAATAIPT